MWEDQQFPSQGWSSSWVRNKPAPAYVSPASTMLADDVDLIAENGEPK